MARNPVPPRVDQHMVSRAVRMPAEQVVLAKAIIEAHEGVAAVFAERGGELLVAAPHDRAAELDELVAAVLEVVGQFALRAPLANR